MGPMLHRWPCCVCIVSLASHASFQIWGYKIVPLAEDWPEQKEERQQTNWSALSLVGLYHKREETRWLNQNQSNILHHDQNPEVKSCSANTQDTHEEK